MKLYIKIILGVVLLFTITGILAALYLYNKHPRSLQNIKPDYTVSASALLKEFEDDETGSTAKYVNRILEVTGTITEVRKSEKDILNVTLNTGNDLSVIICTFPAGTDEIKLVAGHDITVRGKCSGFLMDVLLNDCVVVK